MDTQLDVDELPSTVKSIRQGWLSTFGSAATVVYHFLPVPSINYQLIVRTLTGSLAS